MNPFDSRPGMFDVAWRMFGIQVRIKPSYWIFLAAMAFILGGQRDWRSILAWVLAGFFTSMFEKLFQAITGRCFGYPAAIILVAMGGGVVAEYARAHRWQRIVINAASIVGNVVMLLILCFTAPLVIRQLPNIALWGPNWEFFVFALIQSLLFFTVFGLLLDTLPVLPNSSGQIATDLMGYVVGKRDFVFGTVLSILVAGSVVGYSIYKHYHPDAPYLGTLTRMMVPSQLSLIVMGDSSPLFIAVIFGLSLIYNAFNLFFQKR